MVGARRPFLLGLCLGMQACLRLEDPPPYAENGEPCSSDAMCEPASACEFDSAVNAIVCRVRGGCTSHLACGIDLACTYGSCGPAECTGSSQCGSYACNLGVRQCFDSCASDAHCASEFVCRDGECLSATCTEETAARVCHGASCYGGACDSAIDCEQYGCASGYSCDSVECVRPCTSDADCERYTCYAALGECNESCGSASDCQPGYVCKDAFCQPESI